MANDLIHYKMELGLPKLPDARKIRTAVFIKEQGFQMEFDEIDHHAYHIVVYDGKKPVATGRTYPKPDSTSVYIIGRIAVVKEYRGRNLGGFVVRRLEEKAVALGAKSAELSAQLQAKPFYEKLGFISFGPEYYDEYCPHVSMKKDFFYPAELDPAFKS